MPLPLPSISGTPLAFLGVERSVCGRVWRARLDARGEARATSVTQRHGVSELLARILAGRDVEADAVGEFLDPTVKRLMPDPESQLLHLMPEDARTYAEVTDLKGLSGHPADESRWVTGSTVTVDGGYLVQ